METNSRELITAAVKSAERRTSLWIDVIKKFKVRTMVEVGVFRGGFAEAILAGCDSIEKYYMVDPWRNLDNWNKPANVENDVFEGYYKDSLEKTEFAADRRVVLRGTTTEIIDEIPDGEIDLVYIDGDHTLRGIAIDTVAYLPKIRVGGLMGGDDFCPSIWQHIPKFEPTLVAPFAAHFAEGLRSPIHALPYEQFLITEVSQAPGYELIDHTGKFGELALKQHLGPTRQFVRSARAFAGRIKRRLLPRR